MQLTAIVLFVCGIVEMYNGAIQLNLMSSVLAPTTLYEVLLVIIVVVEFVFATLVGDYLVFRLYGYHVNHSSRERWEEHTGGGGDGYEPAPGRGLRLVLHFSAQVPSVYFLLLIMRS